MVGWRAPEISHDTVLYCFGKTFVAFVRTFQFATCFINFLSLFFGCYRQLNPKDEVSGADATARNFRTFAASFRTHIFYRFPSSHNLRHRNFSQALYSV